MRPSSVLVAACVVATSLAASRDARA